MALNAEADRAKLHAAPGAAPSWIFGGDAPRKVPRQESSGGMPSSGLTGDPPAYAAGGS